MIALEPLLDRIIADNPLAAVPQGLFHFGIRSYPNIALREALLNAFIHADYRIHGPIPVKQFKHRSELGACAMPLMFHFSQRLAQRLGGCQSEATRRILCASYAAADRRNMARRETSGEHAPNRGAAGDRSHRHQPDRQASAESATWALIITPTSARGLLRSAAAVGPRAEDGSLGPRPSALGPRPFPQVSSYT
ncbi:hypothetical protein [Thiohalocapsa sp. ML1]|uniref:hypothetical protein n=1 Tax=Thiohalocapsa sp. ML1 TaxID=1431688 RepID=UPI00073207FC|nr:hypothetical protein [Thiohalocapsa sp. ML1]